MNDVEVRDGEASEHTRGVAPSTIVVPVDGGDRAARALTIGESWARRFRADLVIVAVEGEHDGSELSERVEKCFEGHARRRTVADRSALVPAVVDVVAGNAESAVCVGSGGQSPVVDVTRDEVSQEILRNVDVPVLMIGPRCNVESLDGPVVVAHDGSSDADLAIDPARAWASATEAPRVLLHVLQPLVEGHHDAPSSLRAACAQLGAGARLEVVRASFPAGAIREYVHEVDGSLLVLCTRGRTNTLTASTGRTATWLVRESPCPVLITHPIAARARPEVTNGRRAALLAAGASLGALAAAVYVRVAEPWFRRWGATDEEVSASLPVDELVVPGTPTMTRAITVHAPIEGVWPWLVQIGQDRAGFYSYTWLENLVGAGMHNARSVHPEWQELQRGDSVWLASQARYGERGRQVAALVDAPRTRSSWCRQTTGSGSSAVARERRVELLPRAVRRFVHPLGRPELGWRRRHAPLRRDPLRHGAEDDARTPRAGRGDQRLNPTRRDFRPCRSLSVQTTVCTATTSSASDRDPRRDRPHPQRQVVPGDRPGDRQAR